MNIMSIYKLGAAVVGVGVLGYGLYRGLKKKDPVEELNEEQQVDLQRDLDRAADPESVRKDYPGVVSGDSSEEQASASTEE